MTKVFVQPLPCVPSIPAFCIAFTYREICSRTEYSRNATRLAVNNMQTMLNNNFPKKKKHFWILNKYIIILPEIVLILYFVFILILHILFQIHVQPTLHLNSIFNFRNYD